MAIRPHSPRNVLAALIVVAAFATRAFGLVDSFKVYTIEGYLDRAPNGATIVTRLDIGTSGTPRRQLLVTSYRRSGGLFDDEGTPRSYLLRGSAEDVVSLLGAPQGAAVKGTFAVYPNAVATLFIASLDRAA
jgi:hypothetical protein